MLCYVRHQEVYCNLLTHIRGTLKSEDLLKETRAIKLIMDVPMLLDVLCVFQFKKEITSSCRLPTEIPQRDFE